MDKIIGPADLYLKVLRFVADFSLDIRSGSVKFNKIQILRTFGFAFFCTICVNYFTFVEYSQKGKLFTFLEFYEGLGFVPIDLAVGGLLIYSTAIGAYVNHLLLYKKREKIEKFLKDFVLFEKRDILETSAKFDDGGKY
jgi:hypothetical protein